MPAQPQTATTAASKLGPLHRSRMFLSTMEPGLRRTLGVLLALSALAGYQGTIITSALTFAADGWGKSTGAQSRALAFLRADILGICHGERASLQTFLKSFVPILKHCNIWSADACQNFAGSLVVRFEKLSNLLGEQRHLG